MTSVLHITNARIWTGEPARPAASSISIRDGIITGLDLAAGDGDIIDAVGRTIVPGLIDAHMHLLMGGQSLGRLDLSRVTSRGHFEQAIARQNERLPAGAWLIAFGWSGENWRPACDPDKSWLAAAGDRPAVCHRMDHHAALVNDAVLSRCDLRADPVGGRIVRDRSSGEPTGLLIESAVGALVEPLIPQPDAVARRAALLKACRHANAMGLTTVGSMELATDLKEVYEPLRRRLTVRCRITLLDRPPWANPAPAPGYSFGRRFPRDDRLAVIGYKSFIDGTLGSRTARMLTEYADDPGNRGLLVELAAGGQLVDWARAVAAEGLSPSMHAIGDEAARMALDVMEEIDPAVRPRLEHGQQIDLADLPRCANRIVSMQPLHKADDCRYVRQRLGENRLAGTFAFRRLLDAGARLAFGSDWPVVSCDPLLGIRAAVTGLTLDGEEFAPDQNLTVDEALRSYTVEAAYALGLDHAGCLRRGAFGDLVMFDRDPFTADWVTDPPRVVLTVVGGEIVHDARNAGS